jgi:glycine hydroxymethyltransferase
MSEDARQQGEIAITADVERLLLNLVEADRLARASINLVPSENRLSPLAQIPLSTDFYNRYFFNQAVDPAFWQFRGGQEIHRFETSLAESCLRRLGRAQFVNMRPISGMSAMMLAISALGGERGSDVVSLSHTTGGHFATENLIQLLGYRPVTIDIRAGECDEEALASILQHRTVSLVYLDLQNSLHILDLAPVVRIVRTYSPQSYIHADCSHTMGLVLGGAVPNPLEAGTDSMGGSTHKTFPGPHKGVLFTNTAAVYDKMSDAQMKLISSHHFAETLSLGLAAAEYEIFGSAYSRAVVSNAQMLGNALSRLGFEVVRAGAEHTYTHQVWVRIGNDKETDNFSQNLYERGIRANVQTDIPGHEGPMLRLGVAEMTFEGASAESIALLGELFSEARNHKRTLESLYSADVRSTFQAPFFFLKESIEMGVLSKCSKIAYLARQE